MAQTPPIYDRDWFKKRAFSSLQRIDEHTWDFSDSLLLYVSSGAEVYESIQETNSPYYKLVTKPEREYLASIAKDIINTLPDNFEYIDLGPGTEHKEQFFFDELKKQNKKFTYIPVDISRYYLDLAQKYAANQDIPVKPMQTSFEELPKHLKSTTTPRFVSLGLTFSNYNPEAILPLLQNIAGTNGFAFINAHIRDRIDMPALQKIYALDVLHIADEKLKLIGLDPAQDVTDQTADDGIKFWCTLVKSNDELMKIGMTANDKLLVFQSLRYTKESLEMALNAHSKSFQTFDTTSPFIAALIRA